MTRLFFRSLGLQLGWLLGALKPGPAGAPLGPRRLLLLLVGGPAFLALQLCHWAGLFLDEILFPGYRRVEPREPLFVTGIPRSGTTFVHRTLASAEGRFSTFKTWEAVLAPSIVQRKLLHALAAADRAVGSPLRRVAEAVLRRAGGRNAIHEVDLFAAEEDYLALLPAAGCFLPVLAFPHADSLWALGRMDTVLPEGDRGRVLEFYRRCVQRHLYSEGRGRRFLSKNAAFASWAPGLRETFSGARFLICVREPVTALSSQLSSVAPACRFAGIDPVVAGLPERFRDQLQANLEGLRRFLEEAGDDAAAVDMGELETEPAEALRRCLDRIGERPDPALDAALARAGREARGRRSAHRHAPGQFGLRPEEIESCLSAPYQAILRHCAGPIRRGQ